MDVKSPGCVNVSLASTAPMTPNGGNGGPTGSASAVMTQLVGVTSNSATSATACGPVKLYSTARLTGGPALLMTWNIWNGRTSLDASGEVKFAVYASNTQFLFSVLMFVTADSPPTFDEAVAGSE